MKITDVRVRLFEMPMQRPFHPTWEPLPHTKSRIHVVEIHTDEGITGIGSGGVPVRWDVAGRFLVGQDPFRIEQHVYNLRSMAFFTGRVWPVEIALWDIIGKACGQPVYKLLGGGSDRLRAYASSGECRPAAQRVEAAKQVVSEGFRALKIRFHSEDWRDDVKTLAAVREAVGDKVDIMVDGNWGWRIPPDQQRHRWDLRTAISAAKAMEEYGVYWLEEPLDAYDYDGLAELRRHLTTLRLAGGELNRGPEEVKTYLEKGCFDVYQPDCTMIGGISTTRKIAAMVESHGLVFTPHTWTNGIGMMANLQCAAAARIVPYIEFPYDPPNWSPAERDFLFADPITIDAEGYIPLPQKPGLGIEIDEEKAKLYEVKRE
ncbi:MAG TPA: mandelate racemase/muconate lactonizing enzyme family protein [Dehalococcoidia bacterium]|jgi:L-alanine-DL-glutamate epimerase-like enolase superfamily enzyme|nr:mandelate racemase/muconate lactonizing enzyme family protein [Dehalococcoidia bacterium]